MYPFTKKNRASDLTNIARENEFAFLIRLVFSIAFIFGGSHLIFSQSSGNFNVGLAAPMGGIISDENSDFFLGLMVKGGWDQLLGDHTGFAISAMIGQTAQIFDELAIFEPKIDNYKHFGVFGGLLLTSGKYFKFRLMPGYGSTSIPANTTTGLDLYRRVRSGSLGLDTGMTVEIWPESDVRAQLGIDFYIWNPKYKIYFNTDEKRETTALFAFFVGIAF